MSLRLFAAISPPEDVRERLAALQAGLEGRRLVPPENFHLTLAFFGEVGDRGAEDLHVALGEIRGAPFDLWLDGVGAFGDARPRAVYAAVRPDSALTELRDRVRAAARAAGLESPARRYVPHITLARGGGRADRRFHDWARARSEFLTGPLRVENFGLFRSDLGRAAPIYTELSAYDLVDF